MSNYGITSENLLRSFPSALRADNDIQSLAAVIADELVKLSGCTGLATIYSRIDDLDEELLDALASDFKVDWWRPNSTIEEKRRILKTSWYVHKHLGTKAAIETAIADYLGDGNVEEWFEYSGKPYHFRIASKNNDAIIANYDAFMSVLEVVQRRSAVLDHITSNLMHGQSLFIGTAMRIGKIGEIQMEPVDVSALVTPLADEMGAILCDSFGNILIYE